MSTPDLVEPIIAWRTWRVDQGRLSSWARIATIDHTFDPCVWPEREPFVAQCLRSMHTDGHTVPQEGCSCGIYALKNRPIDVGLVLGKVALWGKVIEHSAGYRAQYAYPIALEAPRRLCARYGVARLGIGFQPPSKWLIAAVLSVALQLYLGWLNTKAPAWQAYGPAAISFFVWMWTVNRRLALPGFAIGLLLAIAYIVAVVMLRAP